MLQSGLDICYPYAGVYVFMYVFVPTQQAHSVRIILIKMFYLYGLCETLWDIYRLLSSEGFQRNHLEHAVQAQAF